MLLRHVLCFAASLLLLAGSAYAQRTVSYQGYLTDDAGTPVTQTDLAVDFGLFDVAVGGTSLWAESQTVDVEDGIFTTALGQNTPFPPTLDFNQALYLELTVDGTALTPRVLLRAAPSALSIPGVHARPDQDFVGINRENRIGSEYFGVRAPVFTSGTSAAYGGMYMETAGAGSRPFYGYATDGDSKAWHYYDGNTDKWHLNVSGNRLTVLADGRVGIGTTSPENPLSVAGIIESTTGGIQFPDGTVQASAASGGGNLSFPLFESVSTSSAAFEIDQSGDGDAINVATTGGGNAGSFAINNTSSSAAALVASTTGAGDAISAVANTGNAGDFRIIAPASDADVVSAFTSGSGNAITARTSGGGSAVFGTTTGETSRGGHAGEFTAQVFSSTSPDQSALYVATRGDYDQLTMPPPALEVEGGVVGSGSSEVATGKAATFRGDVDLKGNLYVENEVGVPMIEFVGNGGGVKMNENSRIQGPSTSYGFVKAGVVIDECGSGSSIVRSFLSVDGILRSPSVNDGAQNKTCLVDLKFEPEFWSVTIASASGGYRAGCGKVVNGDVLKCEWSGTVATSGPPRLIITAY
jgi:hypothetical protein